MIRSAGVLACGAMVLFIMIMLAPVVHGGVQTGSESKDSGMDRPPPPHGPPPFPGMGPGHHGPGGDQQLLSRLEKMTPAERGAFFEARYQEHKAERAKLEKMTPEQRHAYFEQRHRELLASLPAAERKKAEERHAKRRSMHKGPPPSGRPGHKPPGPDPMEKLEKMTVVQRQAFFEARYQEHREIIEKTRGMTEKERRAFFEKRREEWLKSLSPEERKRFEMRDEKRRRHFEALSKETR